MFSHIRRHMLFLGLSAFSGLLYSAKTLSQDNRKALTAISLDEVIRALGSKESPQISNRLLLETPEISAVPDHVPVRLRSELPATDLLLLLVSSAMQPVAAQFTIPAGTEADIRTFIKISGTSSLQLIVRAGGKLYFAQKQVKIALPLRSQPSVDRQK